MVWQDMLTTLVLASVAGFQSISIRTQVELS